MSSFNPHVLSKWYCYHPCFTDEGNEAQCPTSGRWQLGALSLSGSKPTPSTSVLSQLPRGTGSSLSRLKTQREEAKMSDLLCQRSVPTEVSGAGCGFVDQLPVGFDVFPVGGFFHPGCASQKLVGRSSLSTTELSDCMRALPARRPEGVISLGKAVCFPEHAGCRCWKLAAHCLVLASDSRLLFQDLF